MCSVWPVCLRAFKYILCLNIPTICKNVRLRGCPATFLECTTVTTCLLISLPLSDKVTKNMKITASMCKITYSTCSSCTHWRHTGSSMPISESYNTHLNSSFKQSAAECLIQGHFDSRPSWWGKTKSSTCLKCKLLVKCGVQICTLLIFLPL